MAFDNYCKYLAEQYPHHFASWLLGESFSKSSQVEVLKTELNVEPIRADAILQLRKRDSILHIEFQTSPASVPPIPLRMLDYWVRLYREYDLPIKQFVIFLRETAEEIPNELKLENTWHRYNVIKLWQQDKQPFMEHTGLLPLAALTRAETPKELLEEVATRTRELPPNQEKSTLLMCAALLAGLRFEKEVIMSVLREDILKESVIYQDIIDQGLQRGLQQGIVQGMEQGMEQGIHVGKAEMLVNILKHRFQDFSSEDERHLIALNSMQLDSLSLAVLDFHQLSDLEIWLEKNPYKM